MKLGQTRALDAMGYRFGERIRLPLMECLVVENRNLLLISPGPFAPPWPSLLLALKKLDAQAQALMANGKVFLLVGDSPTLRSELYDLVKTARQARKTEVLVPGSGFVKSSIQRRIEPRQLALPSLALLVMLVALLAPRPTAPSSEEVEAVASPVCPIQLGEAERQVWIKDLLGQKPLIESSAVIYQSDLATVAVSVSEAIGSAVALKVIITCSEGIEASFSYRTDLRGELVLNALPGD